MAPPPRPGHTADPGPPIRRYAIGILQLFVLCFALGLPLQRPLQAQSAPKTSPDILIINSYGPGYDWSDDEITGFLCTLLTRYPDIEPVIQYLDAKRFPAPEREQWLLEDIRAKVRTRPPRLLITFDNAAFDFALRHRDSIAPGVPLVFGGLNRFVPEMIAGQTDITGVSEETDFSGTFELINSLTPDTRNIVVIGNRSDSSIEKRKALQAILPKYSDRYTFEFFEDWTDTQLLERVAKLPRRTAGLIIDVTSDVNGTYNYNSAAFSTALATRTNVPIFITSRPPGKHDWSVEEWDGVGGSMVVADLHGAKVGELALRILAGEPASNIPVVRYSPELREVDYRHLRRLGIPEDRVPEGTRVLNAPTHFYQIHRTPLLVAAGVFVVLCGIIVALLVNILMRHRAERALRRAEEQLRTSQKMEVIGRLAGGVAHDFNNILQVIRSHASFLQDSTCLTPTDREDTQSILDATLRAEQLTRQLLLFSRKQALAPGPVEPNALVDGMARMLRRVLGEHIELQVVRLPETVTMLADKNQLEQVLLNLCLNARDAMPSGGRIVISLEQTHLAEADCARSTGLRPGPHLRLKVGDTGTGMPPNVLEHLFEPFFTTKAPGKGTGLGLSVVYGIVQQHGGAISAYSEVGQGSVFSILLPLVVAESPDSEIGDMQTLPRGHGTILLAEDDPSVRDVSVRVLEQNGFTVITANNGEEAEAQLAAHHAEIRLAILDVVMPKRSGRQVHDTIRAHYAGIPVLFCSGYTAEMLPPGTAPEPGVELIHKPCSARELLTAVHRLLRQ